MDKIANGVVRFACDCFDQGHGLQLLVERDEKGTIALWEISLFLAGKPSLWWRIKQAIKCLKGKDGDLGEFILAPRDYANFAAAASQLVTYSCTASTSPTSYSFLDDRFY